MNFKKLFALLVVASSAAGLQANGLMSFRQEDVVVKNEGNKVIIYLNGRDAQDNKVYFGSITLQK